MIKKIIDWFLVFATTITLLINISILYAKKFDYLEIKKLNPDITANSFFSIFVLSPVISKIIIAFIILNVILNIVKEFYISSIKKRLVSNLFIYSFSVILVIQFYFNVRR